MEKFGIFELLDALSAITSGAGAGDSYERDTQASVPVSDSSAPEQPYIPNNADAFTSFLERHNRIAEDIDKRKK